MLRVPARDRGDADGLPHCGALHLGLRGDPVTANRRECLQARGAQGRGGGLENNDGPRKQDNDEKCT